MIELVPDSEEYGRTLPVSVRPLPREGLVSFLLRLDAANGLSAGTVLSAVLRASSGRKTRTRPGAFRQARMFDLVRLARLVHFVTIDEIEALTLAPLARWLRGPDYTTPGARRHRVCPGCLAAGRGIPLVFALASIEGCASCGLELVTTCVCVDPDTDTRVPVDPFAWQIPFACHGSCGLRYRDLEARPLTKEELVTVTSRTRVAEALLDHASQQQSSIDPARLRAVTRELRRARPRLLSTPTIDQLVSALAAAGLSVHDFVSMPDRPATGRGSRRKVAPVERRECPNPFCSGITALPPGTPLLSRLTMEQRCNACGTRFVGDRIDFSFDNVPGYRRSRAEKNRHKLAELRTCVERTCREERAKGRRIVRDRIFRLVGLRSYAPAWVSPRAGLVGIIAAHRSAQRLEELAHLPDPRLPEIARDPHLRAALELFRTAIIDGSSAACARLALDTPLYYRWARTIASNGVGGLRAFVSGRRSPFRHRSDCRWCQRTG